MITGNNLDFYLKNAKWKINIGVMPKLNDNEHLLVMMSDNSIGYGSLAPNYNWSLFKTAYPIKKYAKIRAQNDLKLIKGLSLNKKIT